MSVVLPEPALGGAWRPQSYHALRRSWVDPAFTKDIVLAFPTGSYTFLHTLYDGKDVAGGPLISGGLPVVKRALDGVEGVHEVP